MCKGSLFFCYTQIIVGVSCLIIPLYFIIQAIIPLDFIKFYLIIPLCFIRNNYLCKQKQSKICTSKGIYVHPFYCLESL